MDEVSVQQCRTLADQEIVNDATNSHSNYSLLSVSCSVAIAFHLAEGYSCYSRPQCATPAFVLCAISKTFLACDPSQNGFCNSTQKPWQQFLSAGLYMQWPKRCTVNVAGFQRVTLIEVTRLLLPHQHFAACIDIAHKVGKRKDSRTYPC